MNHTPSIGQVLYVSVLLPEGPADAALEPKCEASGSSGVPAEAHAGLQPDQRTTQKDIVTIERPTLDMVVKQLAVHQAEGRICGKPLFAR